MIIFIPKYVYPNRWSFLRIMEYRNYLMKQSCTTILLYKWFKKSKCVHNFWTQNFMLFWDDRNSSFTSVSHRTRTLNIFLSLSIISIVYLCAHGSCSRCTFIWNIAKSISRPHCCLLDSCLAINHCICIVLVPQKIACLLTPNKNNITASNWANATEKLYIH